MESSQLSGEAAYNIDLSLKLGEGKYSNVYKIQRKTDGMICAAKIFNMELQDIVSYEREDSKKEETILKSVDHPFIIPWIESFVYQQKNLCIVSKFASVGDLEK